MPRIPEDKVRVSKTGRLYLSRLVRERILGENVVVDCHKDTGIIKIRPCSDRESGEPRLKRLTNHIGGSGYISIRPELKVVRAKLPDKAIAVPHYWRGNVLVVDLSPVGDDDPNNEDGG